MRRPLLLSALALSALALGCQPDLEIDGDALVRVADDGSRTVQIDLRTSEPNITVGLSIDGDLLGEPGRSDENGQYSVTLPWEHSVLRPSITGRAQDGDRRASTRLYPRTEFRLMPDPSGLDVAVCVGYPECEVDLDWQGRLSLKEATAGTVLRFAGHELVMPEEGDEVSVQLAPMDLLVTEDLTALYHGDANQRIPIPLTLVTPSGTEKEGSGSVRPGRVQKAVATRFLAVTEGPLDPEGPDGSATLVVTQGDDGEAYGSRLIGEATSFTDVRQVVVRTRSSRTLSGCGSYSSDGGVVQVGRSTSDVTLRIFERKSGTMTAERSFRGRSPRCPSVLWNTTHVSGDEPTEQIDAWLERQIGG